MAEASYFFQGARPEIAEVTLHMSESEAKHLLRFIDGHGPKASDGPVTLALRHILNGLDAAKANGKCS